MKIKRPKKNIFIETAASSDLAFLLIIYFLVIAGFNLNQGFILNLPAKNSTRLVLRDELLRFEMDSGGIIIHNDTAMNLNETERIIKTAAEVYPGLAVVLSIDPQAPWQNVVLFAELAQKLEIESFSFNLRDT